MLLHVLHVQLRRLRVGSHQPVRTGADDAEVDLGMGVVHVVVARQPETEAGVLEPASTLFGAGMHLDVNHVPRLVVSQEREHEHHAAHGQELTPAAIQPQPVGGQEEVAPDPARGHLTEEQPQPDVDLEALSFPVIEVLGGEAVGVVELAVFVEHLLHERGLLGQPVGLVHEGAVQEVLDERETHVAEDRPEQQRGNPESHRSSLAFGTVGGDYRN